MKKKYGALTIILLVLIAIRFLAQVISAAVGQEPLDIVFGGIVGAIYLAAFVGVVMKQKWGSIVALIVAIIDVIAAFFIGGASGVGAVIFDVILFWLAWKELKQFQPAIPEAAVSTTSKKKKSPAATKKKPSKKSSKK